MNTQKVQKKFTRFTPTEIAYHWSYAIPFLLLLLSGALLLLQKIIGEWISKETLVLFHKYAGLSFILLPFLVALAGDWRIHLLNLNEALTWGKKDLEWFSKMSKKTKDLPPMGKFNSGQKINMLLTLLAYFIFSITGIIMWNEKGALSAWYLHLLFFFIMVPAVAGHLYLATWNPDTKSGLPGIFTGNVPYDYVEHHHILQLQNEIPLAKFSFKSLWRILLLIPAGLLLASIILFFIQLQMTENTLSKIETMNKTFLMPGPLFRSHEQKTETKNCYVCHTLDGKVSDQKCLTCHQKIQERIQKGLGFHHLFKDNCASCHKDHQGTEFNAIPLEENKFNHTLAALFPLEGAHLQLSCTKCHQKNGQRQFIGIAFEKCSDCHRDSHQGQFSNKQCNTCHQTQGWKEPHLKFKHTQAQFLLLGKHKEVACQNCHQEKENATTKETVVKYTQISHTNCTDCHRNPHTAPLESRCTDCHNTEGWKGKTLLFEHTSSLFPLRGSHQNVQCTQCHKPVQEASREVIEYKLGLKECQDCHQDAHFGEVTNSCKQCHQESRWSEIVHFEHNRDARFSLKARHQNVRCEDCHRRENATGQKELHLAKLNFNTCQSCHNDPHKGQMTKSCNTCHTEHGWKGSQVLFEHNKDSTFKLVGVHQKVACEACHQKKENISVHYVGLPSNSCADCHKDPHQGQMKKNCNTCHQEQGWAGTHLRFVHNRDSQFKLTGAHRTLKCEECHKPEKTGTPYLGIQFSSCSNCHTDVHQGQLGNNCTKCHSTEGWKGDFLTFNHNQTRFPIGFDHKKVSCQSCHQQKNLFAISDSSCQSCHSDYAQILEGTYLTKTPVPSIHRILKCEQCHQDQKESSLKNPEKQCIQCHSVHYEPLYFNWKWSTNRSIREHETRLNPNERETISKIGTHNLKLVQELLKILESNQNK